MSLLYSHQGSTPQPLPFRINLSNGFTRTDPGTFTEAELTDAGYTGPFTPPAYDAATQRLSWDNGEYLIVELFVDELDEEGQVVKTAAQAQQEHLTAQAYLAMKEADYVGFWSALIRSAIYVEIKTSAKLDLGVNVLATELIALLGDAKAGNVDVEALQQGIWEVAAVLSPESNSSLEAMLLEYGLYAYTLTPPA